MPIITLKSRISIYYEEYGDQKKPAMVFIAGFTATGCLAWGGVAKICAKNYRVIVFDNRGAGQSSCSDLPYTAELLADDTKELCDALNIKQAYFVGNSMGGQIVMTIAHKYPEFVKAAVISNTVVKVGPSFMKYHLLLEAHLSLMKLANAQKDSSTAIKKIFALTNIGWLFSGEFLSKNGIVEELIASHVKDEHPITMSGFINQRNVFMNFDASEWLNKINCPCLVIASSEDMIFPVSDVQKIAQIIRGAKFLLFPNVGHLPHAENPGAFTQALFKFITSLCNQQSDTYVDSQFFKETA